MTFLTALFSRSQFSSRICEWGMAQVLTGWNKKM
jgi:hypothetical protein